MTIFDVLPFAERAHCAGEQAGYCLIGTAYWQTPERDAVPK